MEAVSLFSEKLNIKEDALLLSSHKLYLSYFINVKNELKMNLKKVVIKKIIINTIPLRNQKFRPYI